MTKEKLALEIIERLKKEYPDAGCTLDYDQAWKLLVSVRLAAQCTDARVNVVVEKLYEKYPDVKALAEAPVEDIEAIVKPCGLGHSKARDISACMKILMEQYDGRVPDDFDKLLATMRSRNISVSIIIQNIAQLKALYEKQWESIMGNCDEFLYLGGNETSTHKLISESYLGKSTLWLDTYGKSTGHSGSYSTNNQLTGRDVPYLFVKSSVALNLS